DERKMLRGQIGRGKNQSARDAVELDERQRRGELVRGGDEYAASGKLLEASTEARAPRQIAQGDAAIGAPERALRQAPRGARAASGPPMHGSRLAVDDHGKNLLVAELERLDQQCEPAAYFTQAGRSDRHRGGVARARDVQPGVLCEGPAKRFEVAAQARGIQL